MKDTIEVPRKWIEGLIALRYELIPDKPIKTKKEFRGAIAEVNGLLGYIDSARSFIDEDK